MPGTSLSHHTGLGIATWQSIPSRDTEQQSYYIKKKVTYRGIVANKNITLWIKLLKHIDTMQSTIFKQMKNSCRSMWKHIWLILQFLLLPVTGLHNVKSTRHDDKKWLDYWSCSRSQ